ncbi:MAG: hypothetical protein AAF821_19240 [Cyanobacteria bacterium P01_D01_bin.156]
MTSAHPWPDDSVKGVQEIPIVESSAHFDLTEADVAAARQQGLEITSIRAFCAHADDRLHETPPISDTQARDLMQRLVNAWPHLPVSDTPRYVLDAIPGKSITLTTLDGQLLYRQAGEIIMHNRLHPADDDYLSSQLTSVDTMMAAQQLMNQVLAHLDHWPSDPSVLLTLTVTDGRLLLARADGTTVYEHDGQQVLCCDITPVEWQSLTQRLARIIAPSPDPDPDLEW